jgi:putative hydrolase of the HAD superfamily
MMSRDRMAPDILALDAMGVLYAAGDDVGELLVPFVRANGGSPSTRAQVEAIYMDASIGELTAADIWRRVGLDADLEDRYLSGHRLASGVRQCLDWATDRFASICCISNDVDEWSKKLRERFGLERYIRDWFISGEIGARKPDERIFHLALQRLGASADRLLFVDDRVRNLDAAARLGMQTVLVSPAPVSGHSHQWVPTLGQLPQLMQSA